MSIFVYKKEVPAVGAYRPVLELHCFYNIKLKKLCQTDRHYMLLLRDNVAVDCYEKMSQS